MKKVISLLLAAVMLVSMFAGLQITPAAEVAPAAQPYEEAAALPKESTLPKPEREEPLPDEALKEVSVKQPSEAKPVLENREADMAQADDISFSCEIPQSVSGDLLEEIWKYQLLEDNTAMITGCILPTIDMTIPNEIAGKKVTVIGEKAFQGNAGITSVTVSSGIEIIAANAFNACTNLNKVIIPASVEELGVNVFSDCPKLKTAGITSSGCDIEFAWKTAIPENAFFGSELTQISFPTTIKTIGKFAFYYCQGLKEIEIPNGTETICERAFQYCDNLQKVTIPKTVKELCEAFFICDKLKTAGPIGSGCNIEFGWDTAIPENAFDSCTSLEQITIPNGIKTIGGYAFSYCTSLKKVTIPASVKEMGSVLFDGCTKLKTFGPIGSGCNIEIGWVDEIPAEAMWVCNSLESVVIPNTVKKIGNNAFRNCTSLKSVYIPDSVTYIGDWCFYFCPALSKLIVEGSPSLGLNATLGLELETAGPIGSGCDCEFGYKTSVPDKFFDNWTNLKSVELPDSIVNIGAEAFNSCESLESINFPSQLRAIGSQAFLGCKKIKKITLPVSVRIIGAYAFGDCLSIENAGPIGSGCDFEFAWTKILPHSAFSGLNNLKSVIFPEGIERIEDYAFSLCESLVKLEVPETVIYIGTGAFSGCNGLKKIVIPSINPYLGRYLFANCSQLKTAGPIGSGCDIEFGWKLIDLSNTHAFAGMDSLKTLIIPEGTVDIDNQLIRDCNLDSLYLPNSLQYISLCPFALGNSVKHIYYYGTENDLNNTNIRYAAPYLGSPKIHCLGKNPNSDGSEQGLPAYSFNCKEELAKYVDIAEFDKYLYESFKNRLEEIDISAFNIPRMALYEDLIRKYINDYLSYKAELGEPWVWTMSVGKYGNVSTLSVWYFSDIVKESAEFQEKADVLLQGLKNNASLSDLQKALIVHDRLIKYLEYDFNAYNSGNTLAASNLEDVIISGKAVCMGYAAVYRNLLSQLNIQCSIVSSAELDHAWNIVYIEKKPYYVDCTWDDYGGDIVSHSNFLRSDTGIEQTGHTANDYAPAFSMHNTKYDNYAWQNIYSEIRLINNELYYEDENGTLRKFDTSAPSHMHSYTAKVTTSPTCTQAGIKTFTCTCGDTYTEPVAKLTHSYKAVVIAPKATAVGYTCYRCSRCNEYKKNSAGKAVINTFTAPTGKQTLKCKARTATAQTVTWNSVKTATGYQVQISTKDGKKWSTYATLKAGVNAYTFKNLVAGNNYKFRVRFYIKAADGKNYFSPWSTTLNSPTVPSGTTLTKLTPAKRAFVAQWKKNATVTGYQVQYSLKANFASAKIITVKNPKLLKATAAKLYAGKYYFVRIRTYKTIAKANYFSTWSQTYKVKTK